jgi:hypothetical protein
VAQEFMTAFPDMQVLMDGLEVEGGVLVDRWTLVGTNTARARRRITSAHGPAPGRVRAPAASRSRSSRRLMAPLGGSVSVTGEPTYKARLKTVSLKDAALTATYDFTPDDRAEVALEATFDGNAASGT